jgi:8-oxo-dGTP diphosphatase
MRNARIDHSYTLKVKGKEVTFTHRGVTVMPPFNKVTSASVIPFTKDGNIVTVRLRHRGIDIPGGHVEPHEKSPEETLNREVMEEACMTIQKPHLVEVVESDFFEHPTFMLLYGAFINELHDFIPSAEASDRVILDQSEFIAQYEAGSKQLMREAVKAAWESLRS